MNRSKAILVVAAVLSLGALAALSAARAGEPYRLGVALGLSGTGGPYSRQALEAINLAAEEINANGGMLGKHPIQLYVGNTRTRPEIAERVVRTLIERDRVSAVIGTYSSATALAIKPICRANKVLHIASISNSEDITRLDPSPYTFSVVPNTYMMATATAMGVAKLAGERGWKRYVTIASDYAWGRSSQQLQVEILSRLAPDLQLMESYWPRLGAQNFNAFVVAIMAKKPDFVLASLAGADNARWNRAVWDYRMVERIAVPGNLISVSELINQGRWIPPGTYGRTRAPFFAHLDVPMMRALVDTYQSRFGRWPTDWAVMSYDAVYALKQGIEKAGSTDSDKVKDVLKEASIETTRGRLAFRAIDNQLAVPAYFGRVAVDPDYDFPIYHDLTVFPAEKIWRAEAEIRAARGE